MASLLVVCLFDFGYGAWGYSHLRTLILSPSMLSVDLHPFFSVTAGSGSRFERFSHTLLDPLWWFSIKLYDAHRTSLYRFPFLNASRSHWL